MSTGATRRPETALRGRGSTMPDINSDKVCFVIIKAREFDVQEELDADDSNASDDHFMSVYAEGKGDSVRKELKEFIDSMDEDEQCELVALCWVGRGDFKRSADGLDIAHAIGFKGHDFLPVAEDGGESP
jgi:hypothetical protein